MLTSYKNEDLGVFFFSHEAIDNAIAEFNYMPEEQLTFSSYFRR